MSLKSPDDMSPEQLAQALKNIKILETWIEAVKAHAFNVLVAGGEIPGYKIGDGPKKRLWKFGTIEAAIDTLKSMGLSQDDLFPPSEIISLPKAEKLLKEKGLWPIKRRGQPPVPSVLKPFTDYSIPSKCLMPVEAHGDEGENKVMDAEREFG